MPSRFRGNLACCAAPPFKAAVPFCNPWVSMRLGVRLSRFCSALLSIVAAVLAVLPRPLSAEPALIGGSESVAQALCRSDHDVGRDPAYPGRVPDPADLAGIELSGRRDESGRCPGHRAVHARHRAGAPPRRSLRPRTGGTGLSRALCPNSAPGSAISAWRRPPTTPDRTASRTGSRAIAGCPWKHRTTSIASRADRPRNGPKTSGTPGRPNAEHAAKTGSQSCLQLASTLRTEVRHGSIRPGRGALCALGCATGRQFLQAFGPWPASAGPRPAMPQSWVT